MALRAICSLQTEQSKLERNMVRSFAFDWPVHKLHIAWKYMFYLLYYTEQLLFNYINKFFY